MVSQYQWQGRIYFPNDTVARVKKGVGHILVPKTQGKSLLLNPIAPQIPLNNFGNVNFTPTPSTTGGSSGGSSGGSNSQPAIYINQPPITDENGVTIYANYSEREIFSVPGDPNSQKYIVFVPGAYSLRNNGGTIEIFYSKNGQDIVIWSY